jgi:hypothetical protein
LRWSSEAQKHVLTNYRASSCNPYNRIENIHTFYEGNLIKYRLGQFATYEEVRAYRTSILTRYSGAFVQALKNGEPINIQKALNQ